jgi:hypothetical protein
MVMTNKDKCYGCGKEFCICGAFSSQQNFVVAEKFVIAIMILMAIGTILTIGKVCNLCGIL